MDKAIAALSWPHFSFVFAVIFVIMFRAQVGALLGRITSIGKIKTQPNPEVQREDATQREAAMELLLAVGDTPVLTEIEGRLRADLIARHLVVEGETNRVLIKYLAATTAALEFEQIHGLIFGSQIVLLKKLNEVRGQGLSLAAVDAHFEATKNAFPDAYKEWSVNNYIMFLTTRNLVTVQDDNFHLTSLGGEYLVWMTRTAHSENRWY